MDPQSYALNGGRWRARAMQIRMQQVAQMSHPQFATMLPGVNATLPSPATVNPVVTALFRNHQSTKH